MSRRLTEACLILAGCSMVGCDLGVTQPAAPPTTPPAAGAQTQPPIQPQIEPPAQGPVVAEAGVGKRGQSLKNEKGIGRMIAQPAMSLFATEQRMVFQVQIPQALELYKASNGNYPKSHDDFMKQIVQANQIRLPELPAGQVYKFHPDEGLLYVHPAGE